MSAIAIGYNKSELIAAINATILHVVDIVPEYNFTYDVNVVGLAFAKRYVGAASPGGGIADFEDIGLSPPNFNPLIYLIYRTENTYEYIELIEPIITVEPLETRGFTRSLYTNCLVHGSPEELGDFYDLMSGTAHPSIVAAVDALQYATDPTAPGNPTNPTFDNFGFTFFSIDHINTYLTEFTNIHLILSGARVQFGIGKLFYPPEDHEFFTLKLEIFNNPSLVINNNFAHVFTAPNGEDSLAARVVTHSNEVRTATGANPIVPFLEVLNDETILNIDNPNSTIAISSEMQRIITDNFGGNVNNDHIEMIRFARNEAGRIMDTAEDIANNLRDIPDSLRRQASAVAIMAAELASRIVEMAMITMQAVETKVKEEIRDGDILAIERAPIRNNMINVDNLKNVIEGIRSRRMDVIRTTTFTLDAETPLEEYNVMGEPASTVGPPCPPEWKTFG